MGNFHASRTTILTLTLTRAQCNAPATLPASRHAEVKVLFGENSAIATRADGPPAAVSSRLPAAGSAGSTVRVSHIQTTGLGKRAGAAATDSSEMRMEQLPVSELTLKQPTIRSKDRVHADGDSDRRVMIEGSNGPPAIICWTPQIDMIIRSEECRINT
ncbi:hypothetical protein BP00DRAFT_148439 [Aspergillus indologenus CBS 114.80]|uniref:Uncharacterized protein n=1 Tax=Aspergillus indologenus CBS 114.80 TaxID=1450541 RepID=A0A2V5J4V1_9EURO|nr:hypothetical protein BP00DRAFT_148439 [Aspergillus indologenus CBS 114.80]